MAFAILGTPKPAFFDNSGAPLVGGTITTLNPSDDTVKASYPTASDANNSTNGTSGAITLDARGEPSSTQYWGRDSTLYKVVIRDSLGAIIYTLDNVSTSGVTDSRSPVTFASGDATPSISDSNLFITNGTTAITDFDDGVVGNIIRVRAADGADNIQVSTSATLHLNGQNHFIMSQRDTLTLAMFTDQIWTEVGRSVNERRTSIAITDNTRVATTTFSDSGIAGLDLTAATFYKIAGFFKVNTGASSIPDIKFLFQVDNAFQEEFISLVNINDAGTIVADSLAPSSSFTTPIVANQVHGITISGLVRTHATLASVVDLQIAQNTSDAATTTLEAGSWLSFEQEQY